MPDKNLVAVEGQKNFSKQKEMSIAIKRDYA